LFEETLLSFSELTSFRKRRLCESFRGTRPSSYPSIISRR